MSPTNANQSNRIKMFQNKTCARRKRRATFRTVKPALVRIPAPLAEQLRKEAKANRRSLPQQVCVKLEAALAPATITAAAQTASTTAQAATS